MISLSDEQQLSEAMRTAMADVDPPGDLAVAGLARGRRARRRARLLQAGGSVLGIAVIAVAGTQVLGDPAAQDGGPLQRQRRAVVTPQEMPTIDPAVRQEAIRVLKRLLPKGVKLTVEKPHLPMHGVWVVGRYDDGRGIAQISLSIQRFHPKELPSRGAGTCPPPQVRPFDDCRVDRRADRSTLVVNKGFTRPQSNKGEKEWYAELARPDGTIVQLTQRNSAEEKSEKGTTRPLPPLTAGQMTAIVTSAEWNRVYTRLPVPGRPSPERPPEHPGDELMAKLRRLLPKGVRITHPDVSDGYVSLIFGDAQGRTMIGVNVQTWPPKGKGLPGCADRIKADPVDATCTRETFADGTVVYLQQHSAEVTSSGVTVRMADVIYPNGLRIAATVANGLSGKSGPKTRDAPALTLEQLKALATDPIWRS